MPRMIPSFVGSDSPLSEIKVFEALRDQLPQSWVVFHSKRFFLPATGKHPPQEGEVDFIVLDPRRGFITLEVKGGQEVGREPSGEWYSIDHGGRRHRIKDPGAQAQNAAHKIGIYLRQQWRHVPYGWGVVFPFVEATYAMGPELPADAIIDRNDLRDIKPSLEHTFAAHLLDGPPLGAGGKEAFVKAVSPAFRLVASLGSRIREDDALILRLTEEQNNILETLSEVQRVAVKGTAGTGKTLVAVERARRLAKAGRRVLLLCFNAPLGDWLRQTAEGYDVDNFHGFCRTLTRSSGLTFHPPGEPTAQDQFWDFEAPHLLEQALSRESKERWDDIVIDEAQDFKEYWWLAIEKLLRDPEGSLWAFWDPHQNIYGGGPPPDLGFTPATLTYNCRNTSKIAHYSSDLVSLEARVKRGAPEGVDVKELVCGDFREMVTVVRKTLHELVNEENIPSEKIAVLTPRSPQKSPVWQERRLGNFVLTDDLSSSEPNTIRFSSLHRFKGLEADAIILCEIDPHNPNHTGRHLYVGTSRAKHVLIVVSYRPE